MLFNNVSIGTSRVWLMDEAGIFKRHGLNVHLENAQGTAAVDALVAGQYNVGEVDASSVIATDVQQPGIKIVAVGNSKLVYALVARKGIAGADELQGKVFGISKIGVTSDVSTRLILNRLGIDANGATFLQVGNSPQRFAALEGGQIDAMIADPMDIVRARREGFPVIIDQASLNIDYGGDAFAMRESFIQQHRDLALQFVMALVDGIHYYKTHQQEAAQVAAKNLQSDDTEAIQSAVSVFADTIMVPKPYATDNNLRAIIDTVATTEPAAKGADLSLFVDSSLLQEVDQTGYIDALYEQNN